MFVLHLPMTIVDPKASFIGRVRLAWTLAGGNSTVEKIGTVWKLCGRPRGRAWNEIHVYLCTQIMCNRLLYSAYFPAVALVKIFDFLVPCQKFTSYFFYIVEHIWAKQKFLAMSWLVRLAAKVTNQLTEVCIKNSRYFHHRSAFIHWCTGKLKVIR